MSISVSINLSTKVTHLSIDTLVEEGVLVVVDELCRGEVDGVVWELCEGQDTVALLLEGHLSRHLLHQALRQGALPHDVLRGVHFPAGRESRKSVHSETSSQDDKTQPIV